MFFYVTLLITLIYYNCYIQIFSKYVFNGKDCFHCISFFFIKDPDLAGKNFRIKPNPNFQP